MAPLPPHQHPDGSGLPLAEVLRAAADVVAFEPVDRPDEAKRERLLLLCQASGLLDAALAREVAAFDGNVVWAGDGARSASAWMAARTELSSSTARAVARIGREVRRCPFVEAAWQAGAIGTAKVEALLRAQAVHPSMFAEMETALVDEVAPMTVAAACVHLARWSAIAEATRDAEQAEAAGDDPDDPVEEDPAAQNAMHLSQTLGGRWLGDADYDPVTGAEIHAAITARIDAKFAAGVYRADDGMSLAQRRAQCEHELIMRGADPNQTKHGHPRPSVSVEVDARTLAGIPVVDAADAATRRCQLADGTPIARSAAERLLCTCRLTALATELRADGTIEVVGVTDIVRDATAAQRRALRRRDGGCVFPGCSAPPDWCDAHHLWQHEVGGPTLLHNLVLLCKHHHHLVHEGGWHLWRAPEDDRLHLRRPDGTPIAVVPGGQKVPDRPPPVQPPPPPRRNGPPRYLTRRELAELDHRRRRRGDLS